MAGNNDIGASFGDFLIDLIGGKSNVKMAGTAAAEGLDPRSRVILDQIKERIELETSKGPQDVAGIENPSLGDVSKTAIQHRNKLKLLNTLNEFYTKKYGTGNK